MNAFLPHRYYDSAVEGFNFTSGHLPTFIFTNHGQQTTSQGPSPLPAGLGTHLNFQYKQFQSNQHSYRLPLPCQTGPELHFLLLWSALVAPTVKNLPEMQEDPGSIPRLRIFPREGNGNPLQYSCLEIPVDRGYSLWGHKESDTTKRLTLSYFT